MMTNEEKYISSKMGRENHFSVPEGYFDQLATQVMSRVDEPVAKVTLLYRLRPLLYAAACLCLFVFGATLYFNSNGEKEEAMLTAATETTTIENYLDEAADYAMIDNQEIYACLTNEY